MSEPRSGDQVLNTVALTGLFAALLAPWIDGGMLWTEAHTAYVRFSPDYRQTLEGVLQLAIPFLIAKVHMSRIRGQRASEPTAMPTLPIPEEWKGTKLDLLATTPVGSAHGTDAQSLAGPDGPGLHLSR
jgi:hypothetical protein